MLNYLLLVAVLIAFSALAKDEIVLWERNYERPAFKQIVMLAAQYSADKYGGYSLSSSPKMEQGRAFQSLQKGQLLNVAIAGSDINREQAHHTIYVPVDRGLLGFRLCLSTANFDQLENDYSLPQIQAKRLSVGQGAHWPDKHIFLASGIAVVTSPLYENLFQMLRRSRFDCFPRSVNEIGAELARPENADLVVEDNLAFLYPLADFVFVSRTRPNIYARLKYGMQQMLRDGEFYRHFEQHYALLLAEHNFYARKLVMLKNPGLSERAREAINEFGIASFVN